MQTFLPYESFTQSAKCLDNKRLGKQRVECLQILNALEIGPTQQVYNKNLGSSTKAIPVFITRKTPWYNHPAVQMWKGYEDWLCLYARTVCREWISRVFKDILLEKFDTSTGDVTFTQYPKWLGNQRFHDSHKSNLLRKDPTHYSQFGWDVPNDLPYVWPTKEL